MCLKCGNMCDQNALTFTNTRFNAGAVVMYRQFSYYFNIWFISNILWVHNIENLTQRFLHVWRGIGLNIIQGRINHSGPQKPTYQLKAGARIYA